MKTNTLEETEGYKIAITFKPFIDPGCKEHLEIVKDMARAINKSINSIDRKSDLFHKGYEAGKAEQLKNWMGNE